ncbi:amidohydrolase family protein [Nocardia sp. NPDC020380]|uniref:amidohydrolase family protein n=1 Tax=Nocardia sp. NPDC020380 TaxID=3364309 RepID=UPI00378ED38C
MTKNPIVDAHLHLWDITAHPWYPGLTRFRPEIAVNFLLDDYDRAAGDTTVSALVHVSATSTPHAYLDETRWVDELATAAGRTLVSIGTVDPTLPRPELLDHLERQSRSPRFRGVRVFAGLSPNTPAADAIASWLQDRDAVFDLVTRPDDMLDWIDFLAGYPKLRVVLEHLGMPRSTEPDDRAAWHNALSLAAKETQWLCKLSGLGLICPDLSWPTLEYWLESSVHLWGWRRLMFGSNMPVDSTAGTYTDLIATVDRMVTADATDQEAAFFYRTNATDTYRIS